MNHAFFFIHPLHAGVSFKTQEKIVDILERAIAPFKDGNVAATKVFQLSAVEFLLDYYNATVGMAVAPSTGAKASPDFGTFMKGQMTALRAFNETPESNFVLSEYRKIAMVDGSKVVIVRDLDPAMFDEKVLLKFAEQSKKMGLQVTFYKVVIPSMKYFQENYQEMHGGAKPSAKIEEEFKLHLQAFSSGELEWDEKMNSAGLQLHKLVVSENTQLFTLHVLSDMMQKINETHTVS